ncbi:DUF2334 domain-containing protein [Candidatus Woesearchaeota archaeon]|nr:DUF2334 domain-containing protein [Candidatus Woesearchaeota archaeon]
MNYKNIIYYIIIIILLLLFIRLSSPTQIDDVNPRIQCDKELLDKSDILFVIPKYEGVSISDNLSWCKEILSLNKTLGMHGVDHTYNEFGYPRTQEYLDEGIKIFEDCFGFKPKFFKAPQLNVSQENKILIENNMKLIDTKDHIFHKVYHCSDTGYFSNNLMKWI